MSQRLLISQRAGGAGLNTLAAEGTGRIAQLAVELGGDLGVEAAIHHADRVIALLLGAHAHAAIAGDTQVVIAQQKRVFVVGAAGFRRTRWSSPLSSNSH